MAYLKFVDKLNKFFELLLATVFFIMTCLIFIQVLVRFVFTYFDFNVSVPWTEEIARYIMIWVVFLGAALSMRKDNMIQLDPLVNAMSVKSGKIVKIASLVTTAIFFIIIIVLGYDYVMRGMEQMSPVLQIPMGIAFLSIPFGAIVMVLNIIAIMVESKMMKKDIRFISTNDEELNIE
ncbi:TRAP transporter small permease [Sporosarcina sp. P33]|uniref:TRAP transporter small permease n=1 Tax=Sporosarcina sp. P33 TaxID=1930764 RepID=UPI0009C15B79|nr:TRAP transporter small permease [Sporosarcina sp. P33]ARD49058.1 hypothetical protein SporoP33_12970 [Sporosarcina sp. P33]